jgi:hypothetical protein
MTLFVLIETILFIYADYFLTKLNARLNFSCVIAREKICSIFTLGLSKHTP